ncbi:1-deoxy-D-xylulose-5-phosphate synthase [Owenweeksia hongkongensis]|uniref:1-deoxy-D-xylulose-5-phosphate synthase n=1 Tax=Owenweeksia hongkongensis TaxID=253245 RepID=UPI003A95B8C1
MLLDKINIPADLKHLAVEELPQLCEELRAFIPQTTQRKEGHINASLGVAELSVALHYILDTPKDILVWDVGHQAYIHKVLTGRKKQFHTNRLKGGISGFTRRTESQYDPFGAGHSSTSISAVAGFAEADILNKLKRNRVAVIGDGALTGGMSFEALNYLGERNLDVLIVLNDNNQSIDDNKGALSVSKNYKQYFESLGVNFLGSVNGVNVKEVVESLNSALGVNGPRCIRVTTSKQFPKGEKPLSGLVKPQVTFQTVLGKTVLELGTENEKLVVVSPAMLSGGGFGAFQKQFPARTFDVGIAEQHAVTMAAGMAAAGSVPLVHLYSTFAQRGYDQIIHDAALQNLHMVFCLDRAGLVGEDGATHHGTFDVGFLNTLPGVNILAPRNGGELEAMLNYAASNHGVWFIRYPKANTSYNGALSESFTLAPKCLKKGEGKVVLSFGSVGEEVEKTLDGLAYAHYDIRQLKPLDESFIDELASNYEVLITVEENSPRGGLGDTVGSILHKNDHLDTKLLSLSLPDKFIEHGSRTELLKDCGLDAESLRQAFLLA